MSPEDVYAPCKCYVGNFHITTTRVLFEDESNFCQVFVLEDMGGWWAYVDLARDARFAWFSWMQAFDRFINDEDVVEFDAHVWTVFHKIGHPTFKLSRRSIVRLFERCEELSKKGKSRGKQGPDPNSSAEAPGRDPQLRQGGGGDGERPRRGDAHDRASGEAPGQGLGTKPGGGQAVTLPYTVKIPDNPPERTYACPGCKKGVRATRIGNSCSYVVEHLDEKKGKHAEDGEGKCKYKGPVEVK